MYLDLHLDFKKMLTAKVFDATLLMTCADCDSNEITAVNRVTCWCLCTFDDRACMTGSMFVKICLHFCQT